MKELLEAYAESDREGFVRHFRQQVSLIDSLAVTYPDGESDSMPHFQMVLYLSVMDCIARPMLQDVPKRDRRGRVTRFVTEFTDWGDDSLRISLPHLQGALDKQPENGLLDGARAFSAARRARWPEEGDVTLEHDPTLEEVREHMPAEAERALLGRERSLEFLQHRHLLYNLRNSLVHEQRTLGYRRGQVLILL